MGYKRGRLQWEKVSKTIMSITAWEGWQAESFGIPEMGFGIP